VGARVALKQKRQNPKLLAPSFQTVALCFPAAWPWSLLDTVSPNDYCTVPARCRLIPRSKSVPFVGPIHDPDGSLGEHPAGWADLQPSSLPYLEQRKEVRSCFLRCYLDYRQPCRMIGRCSLPPMPPLTTETLSLPLGPHGLHSSKAIAVPWSGLACRYGCTLRPARHVPRSSPTSTLDRRRCKACAICQARAASPLIPIQIASNHPSRFLSDTFRAEALRSTEAFTKLRLGTSTEALGARLIQWPFLRGPGRIVV